MLISTSAHHFSHLTDTQKAVNLNGGTDKLKSNTVKWLAYRTGLSDRVVKQRHNVNGISNCNCKTYACIIFLDNHYWFGLNNIYTENLTWWISSLFAFWRPARKSFKVTQILKRTLTPNPPRLIRVPLNCVTLNRRLKEKCPMSSSCVDGMKKYINNNKEKARRLV